ncbi:NTP transferase domain-containing protein [Nonomuraea sp. NPDC049158]|uniref:NTP transferase domain-containing protein n=1 Tax=Nonomuraea sp. NPDC049158 TaxID=3155649 RepID=UPI0033F7D8A5
MTIGGEYDAVILAGGQARRLGGLDKPGLSVGARAMIEGVVLAVSGARRVIVVGPERPLPGVSFAREDPPGGGPVPALRAGLREVTAPRVVLLAGDLPYLRAGHLAELLRASDTGAGHAGGGVVAVDDGGREQWLLSLWPAERLRRALEGYSGRSLRGLLGPLVHARVALPGRPWFDCDTMDDLEEARMNVLNEWTALACQELGIDPARVDRDLILDLTKEVAHGVARPAAPLTAYLLGLAEGAGTAPEDAVARITALAKNWGAATAETLTES